MRHFAAALMTLALPAGWSKEPDLRIQPDGSLLLHSETDAAWYLLHRGESVWEPTKAPGQMDIRGRFAPGGKGMPQRPQKKPSHRPDGRRYWYACSGHTDPA